jgi:mannitol/fructose-specific phosphotransferase system IIA component (Ntr-type)
VLKNLTEAAWCESTNEQRLQGLTIIREKEEQGSTFFNEGVAFPHARIEGLKSSCISIGIPRRGVTDVTTEKPIECVFLIFSPADSPDEQIHILGLASKAALDRQLMQNLLSASTSDNAYTAIRNWENLQ